MHIHWPHANGQATLSDSECDVFFFFLLLAQMTTDPN